MSARSILRGGVILTAGNMVGAAASFARNIIVARLISVEDFGIAALLALSMSFVEMVSNLAIDRLLVQARDGDSERMQSTGQAFQAARGIGSAVVLFFAAGYIAKFFNIQHTAWAFEILAVVPAIRGFIHLDAMRYQREMKFGASAWIEIVPQLAALGFTVLLGIWLDDYRIMLWVIVLQVTLQVATSHALATRKYAWAWDRAVMRRMIYFGWPLMVNGILMFIIFQGDKAIVGAAFTMEELGWYSAAFMLALAPSLIVAKVLQGLFLPLLAKAQDDRQAFLRRYLLALQGCLLAGLGLAASLVVAGPALLILLYGDRYSEGITVMSLLGLMQGIRIAKAGPMIAAMALGSTKNAMYSNLVRALTLFLALMLVWWGWGVSAVAGVGVIGEALGFFVSLILLKKLVNLPILHLLKAIVLSLTAALALYVFAPFVTDELSLYSQVLVGIAVAGAAFCSCLLLMPELLGYCRKAIPWRHQTKTN